MYSAYMTQVDKWAQESSKETVVISAWNSYGGTSLYILQSAIEDNDEIKNIYYPYTGFKQVIIDAETLPEKPELLVKFVGYDSQNEIVTEDKYYSPGEIITVPFQLKLISKWNVILSYKTDQKIAPSDISSCVVSCLYSQNEVCFYDASFPDDYYILNPELTLEENKAGSFIFTVLPGAIGYDEFFRFKTVITVKRMGKEIWQGRVIDDEMDFYKRKKITCEGEFAYFNDIVHPYKKYKDLTPEKYIAGLISVFNTNAGPHQQYNVGNIENNPDNFPVIKIVNYENIMTLLKELYDTYGGIFRVRKSEGVRYLDWLKDYPRISSQTVEFGKNLLDYARSFDATDICTAIVPLGTVVGSEETGDQNKRLTCAPANNDSPYVLANEEVLTAFGRIEKTLIIDDVTSEGTLLSYGKAYLSQEQFDKMTIEVTAVDLALTNTRDQWKYHRETG